MKTDIEIARETKTQNIKIIAQNAGLLESEYELYGTNKAKICKPFEPKTDNLILVTATNPTPQGEGKTTVAIGIADALRQTGRKACVVLREPSLGPVFGIKGGAAGGGYSQVVPMEEINLHFTGDFHAITVANNLISAIIDNHIHQGNELNIDINRIVWKRCMDMNDRALREITVAEGSETNGVERKDGFNITAASEIMAVFCLSVSLEDLKRRIGNIIVAYSESGKLITVRDLGIVDAVAIVLKEAFKPNLVQTLEGTPAIIHGGPFANIAHGCNSIIATKTGLAIADYVVTEAGFGADLGAEKFIDIKCRKLGKTPKAVVLVSTIKSLKYNGSNGLKEGLKEENIEYLTKGMSNLGRHINNLKNVFNVPVIVAINKFDTDTSLEIQTVIKFCKELGAECEMCEVWAKGGKGGISLAESVVRAIENNSNDVHFAYDMNDSVENKIKSVASKIYGARDVVFEKPALEKLELIKNTAFDKFPVCIAKTQYSFSDNPALLCTPSDYTFHVRDLEIRAGAEFVVVLAGKMLLMPGLSRHPAALDMKIDSNGTIEGLS